MMVNKLFVIILLLFSNTVFAESLFISKETETICLTKLKVIEWLFKSGSKKSTSQHLEWWSKEFNKLNVSFPDVFTYTTKVDVERIIREMSRNKNKLQTNEQQSRYMHEEASWCIYYKH